MCASSCGSQRGGTSRSGSKRKVDGGTTNDRAVSGETQVLETDTSDANEKNESDRNPNGKKPVKQPVETTPCAWICNYCLRRDQIDDVIDANVPKCPSCHKMCKHLNDVWEENASATPSTWHDAVAVHMVDGKCLVERFGGWEASPKDPEDIHDYTVGIPKAGSTSTDNGTAPKRAKLAMPILGPDKGVADVDDTSESEALGDISQSAPAWIVDGCAAEGLENVHDELFQNLGYRAYSRTRKAKERDYKNDLKMLRLAIDQKSLRAYHKICRELWVSLPR